MPELVNYLNSLDGVLPPKIVSSIRFMITTYTAYCRPGIFNNCTSGLTVSDILRKSAAGMSSFQIVEDTISDPLIRDIYVLLTSSDDDNVDSSAIQALTYAKYAKALHDSKWQQMLYYSAIRIFDYVNITKNSISYVHGDDIVDVGVSNVVTIDDEVYIIPSEIDHEGRTGSSSAYDSVFEYVDDHVDLLFSDNDVSAHKMCVAIDEYSASIRDKFPDERYNVRDNRGILQRDDYYMNYIARSFYDICITLGARFIVLEDYDAVGFSFLQSAFISYNKSTGISVDIAPVLYAADVYVVSDLDRCDLYVVGIFKPRGSKRYSKGRVSSSPYDAVVHNSNWASVIFDSYSGPVLVLFESFPLAIVNHNGFIVAPVKYSKSLVWCPASPHRTRGFVLCGANVTDYPVLGSYDNSLRDYFLDLFFFSFYRNYLIFPDDCRISTLWNKVLDLRIFHCLSVPAPSFNLFYDGSFLFLDKDKYYVFTGSTLGYTDYSLMDVIGKLRSRVDDDGFVKESTFLLVSGFTRIDLESMLFRGLLVLKTVSGERFVSSFYWRGYDDVSAIDNNTSFSFSKLYERENNVIICGDGSTFGDVSQPVVSIIPVSGTYNSIINNITGARGVTSILSMFK
jgi:hypothetical protein